LFFLFFFGLFVVLSQIKVFLTLPFMEGGCYRLVCFCFFLVSLPRVRSSVEEAAIGFYSVFSCCCFSSLHTSRDIGLVHVSPKSLLSQSSIYA